MRSTALQLLRIGFLVLIGNASVMAAPIERSVSASRQFIVYGVTSPLRGAVADAAEDTKANVLNLLQQRDEWKIPIILNLRFPEANVPDTPATTFRFSQTGSGLKIQLDLMIGTDFDPLGLRRQLLRVVLLEMAYRRTPGLPAGTFYVEPPDWLIEGFLAASPLQDRVGFAIAITRLIDEERILPLDVFLGQKLSQLDAPSELLYRGYAFALLQLLLQDSSGPAHLANYIANLSQGSNDPVADVKVFFPLLASGPAADALWKASIATLKSRTFELLTPVETERRLAELLGTKNTGDDRPGPIDWKRFTKRKISVQEATELRQLRQQLILLTAQANPILRGVVAEYQQILERILAHKARKVVARLASLDAMRQQIRERARDIDDYMNWFEVTKSGSASGAFTSYLRAAARANEPHSRRRDPLSVYLNALEEQF